VTDPVTDPTRLSVNLNKFALLRNSRGINRPSVEDMARRCLSGGAGGITVHPREDQRHSLYQDVVDLSALLKEFPGTELNVEGTPHADLLQLVLETSPHQCTLVPDLPGQLTSDHGWDVKAQEETLREIIAPLREAGIRVSLFLDADPGQLDAAKRVGADRIELYTGPYAHAFWAGAHDAALKRFATTAAEAISRGLEVNAGHDLDQQNLGPFLRAVPGVKEVSIGHAFICECVDNGFDTTLRSYLAVLEGAAKGE
jgi:pyridoxine 5-phosphate synthase